MTIGYKARNPINILNSDDISRIHEGSLNVLRDCGVKFEHPEALTLLAEAGCEVDREKMVVRFPVGIVEESLKKIPDCFTLKARNSEYDLKFSGSEVYFANTAAPSMVDLRTGQRRLQALADVTQLVTVIDALKDYHACFLPAITLADKPPDVSMQWINAEMFRRTEKTTIGASFGDSPQWVVRMAEAVGETVMGCSGPVPPLTYPKDMANGLIIYAKNGHPVSLNGGIAMGATGPVTFAGTLVQQNAEVLAGVVLTHLINPGIGTFYSIQSQPMDMRTGYLVTGGIEVALLVAATVQIAHSYKMPCKAQFPRTDANTPDQQCGYEKAFQLMASALAGLNYAVSGGGIDDEHLIDFIQLVIDDEMWGMIGRFLDGIKVNDETLAIDLIKEVGPIPGNYLNKKHTRAWWKQENFIPRLSDRTSFETWAKQGSKDIVGLARERVNEILRSHQPVPLPEDVDRELDAILMAAEKEKLGSVVSW